MAESDRKADILKLIDAELDHIKSEQQRSGWSTWALLAALGTILWLFSNDVITYEIDIKILLFPFVLITFFFDNAIIIKKEIMSYSSGEEGKGRFLMMGTLRKRVGTGTLFAFLSHSLLLIILIWFIKIEFAKWYLILLYLFYGGFLLITVLTFTVLSRYNLPVPWEPRSNVGTYLLNYLFPLVNVAAGVWVFLSQYTQYSFVQYRAALLLICCSYIAFELLSTKGKPYLEESLVRIRRDLAMNQVPVEEAMRRLDITLTGLKVQDALQADVEEILGIYEKTASDLRDISQRVDLYKSELDKDKSQFNSEELMKAKEITGALSYSMYAQLHDVQKREKDLLKKQNQFALKCGFIKGMSPESVIAIRELLEKLDKAKDERNMFLDEIKSKVRKVLPVGDQERYLSLP